MQINKRTLWFWAVIVIASVFPLNVFAQPVRAPDTRLMRSSTSRGADGMWIHTKSEGDDVIVWGSGFGEMLELTPEQMSEFQEFTEALEPPRQQEEREQTLERMQKFQGINSMQTKFNQLLTPEQQSKYAEIAFQASGGLDSRYLNDQLLDVVNLTGAQKDQIRKIRADREAAGIAARKERGVGLPFDWLNATQEEREKYVAVQVADQRVNSKVDEALDQKYAEQMKTVLTAEQRAKAEKLTAEAPALVAKLMGRKPVAPGRVAQEQRAQQGQVPQQQTPSYIYVPHAGSWQPGDPLPVPIEERKPGNFPRKQ